MLQELVVLSLVADIHMNDSLILAYRRNNKPTRPEALTHKTLLYLSVHARQVNRALAHSESNHMTHRVLGRNREENVNVVGLQVPLPPLLSFCSANRLNTSPKRWRSSLYNFLRQ